MGFVLAATNDSGEWSTRFKAGVSATIGSPEQMLVSEKEPAMARSRGNERQSGTAPEHSPSSLLPMLIGGLVLIVIAMFAVAAFT